MPRYFFVYQYLLLAGQSATVYCASKLMEKSPSLEDNFSQMFSKAKNETKINANLSRTRLPKMDGKQASIYQRTKKDIVSNNLLSQLDRGSILIYWSFTFSFREFMDLLCGSFHKPSKIRRTRPLFLQYGPHVCSVTYTSVSYRADGSFCSYHEISTHLNSGVYVR